MERLTSTSSAKRLERLERIGEIIYSNERSDLPTYVALRSASNERSDIQLAQRYTISVAISLGKDSERLERIGKIGEDGRELERIGKNWKGLERLERIGEDWRDSRDWKGLERIGEDWKDYLFQLAKRSPHLRGTSVGQQSAKRFQLVKRSPLGKIRKDWKGLERLERIGEDWKDWRDWKGLERLESQIKTEVYQLVQ